MYMLAARENSHHPMLQASCSEVEQLCAVAHNARYLMIYFGGGSLGVVLRRDAGQQDELRAFGHGWVLWSMLQRMQVSRP